MRTTLNINDDLMLAVKRSAAATGRTLTEMVETALRAMLEREALLERDEYELRWEVVPGGAQPGTDISDRDALYDRMEGRK